MRLVFQSVGPNESTSRAILLPFYGRICASKYWNSHPIESDKVPLENIFVHYHCYWWCYKRRNKWSKELRKKIGVVCSLLRVPNFIMLLLKGKEGIYFPELWYYFYLVTVDPRSSNSYKVFIFTLFANKDGAHGKIGYITLTLKLITRKTFHKGVHNQVHWTWTRSMYSAKVWSLLRILIQIISILWFQLMALR